jgi:hypothetical protein
MGRNVAYCKCLSSLLKMSIRLTLCSHRPLKHGSVRGLGWSVGVKVPGFQITLSEARRAEKVRESKTVHTRCTSNRSTKITKALI